MVQRTDLTADPFHQFGSWFQSATDASVPEPNAMTLATATSEGAPSARMVLLKYWDENGFVFFTNLGSRKADELSSNPQAALLFYWKELHRQIRVEGCVERVSTAQTAKYFATRPRGSQLGAWCSEQSTVISSRSVLQSKLAEIRQRFKDGEVPLPSFWGGYRVIPQRFEFWQQGDDRLHDRFVYAPVEKGDGWFIERLAP